MLYLQNAFRNSKLLSMKNKGKTLIVLKATQEKILAALQSVAGIVERRNTLPILANVLIRKTGVFFTDDEVPTSICQQRMKSSISTYFPLHMNTCSKELSKRASGFFTAAKLNLRNAP